MKNKMKLFCLILCFMLSMPISVAAQGYDSTQKGSISITLVDQKDHTPIEGVVFSLYYIATVDLNSDGNLSYAFSDQFKNEGLELDDPSLSSKLEQLVDGSFISSSKATTGSDGKAVFDDVSLGYYFVKQTNSVEGYAPCTSFLVTVPIKSGNEYIYHVDASPKIDIARLIDITIKKVWNTDESTPISKKVTVQLLKEDTVVETIDLNEENHWETVLEELPQSDSYRIVEVNVPKGFTATYRQNAYTFTVTNTSSLIHTGQIIWPIPVLALSGLLLIVLGVIVLRKEREYNA